MRTTSVHKRCCRESGRKFDVKRLSADLLRVYKRLEETSGEEYALIVVFTIRTAIGLHRAWHISVLTNKVLQQLKEEFGLRLAWSLGVTDLEFLIEDGLYEVRRRVPYDYDSEFQNMYVKTAVALVERDICVHDALLFQSELKQGKHTCPSGLFLRSNPGRLILYPFQAATCCVIFFEGDLQDAGVSALCGIIAGLAEWALSSKRFFSNVNESKVLIDCAVGFSTGVIGGLFWNLTNGSNNVLCLKAVFLGTLYWFFYGTAFVIGLLEIIAGELQTGVTRFLAVSVKTFVLSVASALGLAVAVRQDVYTVWIEEQVCEPIFVYQTWWVIPLYLLCSVSVLGQYRFTVMDYWAGLLVQLVAYVVQRKAYFSTDYDGIGIVTKDILGAMSAVATATFIAFAVDFIRYESKIVVLDGNYADLNAYTCRDITRYTYKFLVRVGTCLGLGRNLTNRSLEVRTKLEEIAKEKGKAKDEIVLDVKDEATLIEAAVEAQESSVWSYLMPAVYQLVPGSKIATYWYNVIFPPQPIQDLTSVIADYNETSGEYDTLDVFSNDDTAAIEFDYRKVESAEYALWLTSVSLALGLILGLAAVRFVALIISTLLSPFQNRSKTEDEIENLRATYKRQQARRGFMTYESDDDEDCLECEGASHAKSGQGLRNRKGKNFEAQDDSH